MKKVAFLDVVHPVLKEGLSRAGFECVDLTQESKDNIVSLISDYFGIVIRSRFPLDKELLSNATNLSFIARSGAGLENIDLSYCEQNRITLFNAPEGNRNAVAEHALGMLLSLFNNLSKGDSEVRNGIWRREENRGVELDGKVVGIIGFGNNGKAFVKKLKGFEVEVLVYDKYKSGFGNDFVTECSMEDIFLRADVVSLHIPQTDETLSLVDDKFIASFAKPIYLVNLSRGKIVNTDALVKGLTSEKIIGACLDVLEYEKSSFETLFSDHKSMPASFNYMVNSNKVLLSPHVGGWTYESYFKLSYTLLEKVKAHYNL